MPVWLTDSEYRILSAACDRMIPPSDNAPGAVDCGVPDYIDTLLGAFSFDPPRIWAGGPASGRQGGEPGFERFHGFRRSTSWPGGCASRAPVACPSVSSTGRWSDSSSATGRVWPPSGPTSATSTTTARSPVSDRHRDFAELLYGHVCEGMYGAPEYGGNRDGAGWRAIDFTGDVQPRGWTDDEVSNP